MTTRLLLLLSLLANSHLVSAWYECFEPTFCDQLQNAKLTVTMNDDQIQLKWNNNNNNKGSSNNNNNDNNNSNNINNNHTDNLFGFKVNIVDSADDVIFQSPILHVQANGMTFKTDLPNGRNTVCVQFLHNSTDSSGRVCENIKISNKKVVVGILAGVVFLVPCGIILAVFIYKDKQIRATDAEYHKLWSEHENDSFENSENTSITNSADSQKELVKPTPSNHENSKKQIKSRAIMELVVEEPMLNAHELPQTSIERKEPVKTQQILKAEKSTTISAYEYQEKSVKTSKKSLKETVTSTHEFSQKQKLSPQQLGHQAKSVTSTENFGENPVKFAQNLQEERNASTCIQNFGERPVQTGHNPQSKYVAYNRNRSFSDSETQSVYVIRLERL